MGFKCGIVGLPNVGKSTLFNALTETQAAQAANYPFCTIEPNIGNVAVPDARLDKLAAIAGSQKIIPTQLAFVDIAGLVRGASKGEGLGNQFLGNIREVDAIIHVLRCFEDDDIQHVENKVDPVADAETVETELLLSDLESLEKRVPAFAKKAAQGDKEAKAAASVLGQALDLLRDGKPARLTDPKDADEERILRQAQLLTSKPVLYVCNVEEANAATGNAHSEAVFARAKAEGAQAVIVSAAIESELVGMDGEERMMFLEEMGLHETGLARVIRAGYELLHLLTFFTVGPKEARAWTVHTKSTAISRRASFAPKPSPMTIMSRWAVKPRRAKPASCAPKARPMSCTTVTSCTSCTARPRCAQKRRHCARSEAISSHRPCARPTAGDCVVAALRAMTSGLECREYRARALVGRGALVRQPRERDAGFAHLGNLGVERGDALARQAADPRTIVALFEFQQLGDFLEREARPLCRPDEFQAADIVGIIATDAGAPPLAAAARGLRHQPAALIITDRFDPDAARFRQFSDRKLHRLTPYHGTEVIQAA